MNVWLVNEAFGPHFKEKLRLTVQKPCCPCGQEQTKDTYSAPVQGNTASRVMSKILGLLVCVQKNVELASDMTGWICKGYFLACQADREEKKSYPALKL